MKRPMVIFILIGFLAVTIPGVNSQGLSEEDMPLVFSEDFEKGKPGENARTLGWTVIEDNGAQFFISEEHSLKITHTTRDYNSDKISHPLPSLIKKGSFEFDVKLGSENNDAFSLNVFIGKRIAPFSRDNWMFLESQTDEGTKWMTIKNVGFNAWHHCKIEFDATAGVFSSLKFYVDGELFKTVGGGEFEGMNEISFGDYGLCNGPVTNYLDNIKVYGYKD